MFNVPLAPAPSMPTASLVTLLTPPATVDRSMYQGVHWGFARSVALPLYRTLVLLIFRYNCPAFLSAPRNHSARVLMPLPVQSWAESRVSVASDRGAVVL